MSKFRLHKDMHFELMGREYVIEKRLNNGELRIKDDSTNVSRPITEPELLHNWFEGTLRFLNPERESGLAQLKASRAYIHELSFLNENDPIESKIKSEFHRKRKYIRAVMNARLEQMNEETLQPIITEAGKTAGCNGMPDPHPPSWKTFLYRWLAPFLKSGEDFRVLIPRYKGRGNETPKFVGVKKRKGETYSLGERQKAEKFRELINEVKEEKLIAGQRCSIGTICDAINLRVMETNEFRGEEHKLPLPSRSGLYAFFGRTLDEYEKEVLRRGKKYADQKFRENKQSPIVTRPLERTEIDHTLLDLMVIDTEVMLPIGRPNFTSHIDTYTGMDLGFFASFNCPGYLAVMHCLKHSILPKTYVKNRYPSVKHTWPCYGIPETVVVDNGPEFHSGSLEEAAIQLGFIIQYRPKGDSWYGGTVERHFREINQGLLHRQPGTTFSNVLDKGDYNPSKNAIISFSDFMEMSHIFLVDIYPRQRHRGLKVDRFQRGKLRDIEVVPVKLWGKAIEMYPPALPPHRDELLVLIGELEHRTISSSGIELDGLFYNNEKLSALRREIPKGRKVVLKRDLDDLSRIHVRTKDGDYIQVPAVNQEYTDNLTLWQHKKIKEFAAQRARETVDIHDLLRAKQTIQEIVERSWKAVNKSGTRKMLARFKGIGQEDYGAEINPKAESLDGESFVGLGGMEPLHSKQSSVLKGISDLALDSQLPALQEVSEYGVAIQVEANKEKIGEIELEFKPAKKKAGGNKGKSTTSKAASHPYLGSEVEGGGNPEQLHEGNGSDLDMTGYSASFNLLDLQESNNER